MTALTRFFFLFLLLTSTSASAKINVVTSLTDFAWAAREVGGDLVDAKSLLKGTEDPHYADAVPEFIRLVAQADVVCSAGLELEIGWLPKVLSRSGNAKVQTGGLGNCELGNGIEPLEKPTGPIDRSMGDVHPMGNPHFWLSPKALGQAAGQIRDALVRVDPSNSAAYKRNHAELVKKLEALVTRSRAKLQPLIAKSGGPQVLEYHREFVYLTNLYGIQSLGSIEEKPGVPPSAGRMAEIAKSAKASGVQAILATDYNPRKTIERVSELSGAKALIVPSSVQPNGTYKDYISLHEHIVDSLAQIMGAAKP